MKLVEINCPRSIDLKNVVDSKNIQHLLQSIDIYDKVVISETKEKGIFINYNNEKNEEILSEINKLIGIFSKYINMDVNNIKINIETNKNILFQSKYSILATILLGLNIYYNNILSFHELVYLADEINCFISYYLICGYRKIDEYGKMHNNLENIYKEYLLFLNLNEDEKNRIRNYVYNNKLDYSDKDIYFIAIKNQDILKTPISIKREFNDMKICEYSNVYKNKTLKKYLTFNN